MTKIVTIQSKIYHNFGPITFFRGKKWRYSDIYGESEKTLPFCRFSLKINYLYMVTSSILLELGLKKTNLYVNLLVLCQIFQMSDVNNELKYLNLVSFKLNSPYNHVLYSDCCSAGAPHHPASTNVKRLEDQESMAHLSTRKEESG